MKSSRSFTNQDLDTIRKNAPAQAEGSETSAVSYAPAETESRRSEGGEERAAELGSAFWRDKAEAQRKLIRDLKERTVQVQARIDDLRLDAHPNPPDQFDPNRLQKREAEQANLRRQLELARGELAEAEARLAELYDQARRAGVAPARLDP